MPSIRYGGIKVNEILWVPLAIGTAIKVPKTLSGLVDEPSTLMCQPGAYGMVVIKRCCRPLIVTVPLI